MIGLVALIVFGPRKLPEMMRTIGKAMAEFRRSTDDFKKTWEKEVNYENNDFTSSGTSDLLLGNLPKVENSIGRTSVLEANKTALPEIREINRDDFSVDIPQIENPVVKDIKTETNSADKRNWL